MPTPRVSATMLSARRHVGGRRGMPGMMPRGARGPGARREEGAHRASARAGARRARQGGRGAGRVPQVRGDAPRVRGARQGRSRGSCGRTPSRSAMGPLGCPEPEGDVWAGRAGHACAGGTLRGCARACGACPGTSWFMRMRLCEVMGRALAPSGRGQPSPARSTARAPASRRPAGGPGRRRGCPGSRSARLGAGAPMEDQSSLSSRCSKRYICRTSWARRPFFLATARTLPRRLASLLIPAILTSPPGRPAAPP